MDGLGTNRTAGSSTGREIDLKDQALEKPLKHIPDWMKLPAFWTQVAPKHVPRIGMGFSHAALQQSRLPTSHFRHPTSVLGIKGEKLCMQSAYNGVDHGQDYM